MRAPTSANDPRLAQTADAQVDSATPTELPPVTRRKLKELFTREQLAVLTERSDWRGAWAIAST